MAQHQDPIMSPPVSPQRSNVAKSKTRTSLSPSRHRPAMGLQRAGAPPQMLYPSSSSGPRRNSTFSDSAQSLKSSTDDWLLPRAKSPEESVNHEWSHWHSVPLALALFPAAGGMFFENGSAVITDATLLGLAAVFLNWSVRLPWDWYNSARTIEVQEPHATDAYNDTIIEGASDDDESQASQQTSPPAQTRSRLVDQPSSTSTKASPNMSSAARELRIHELLAFIACFISPIIGAWLLHHIRGQLSRPSEGLVSNYNLTIFILASELRPLSHLIKLVQARTLHLQRTVSTNPYSASPSPPSKEVISDLADRISELETQSSNGNLKSPGATHQQQQELVTATRKILQPDVDALNRAVRRYEKRATLLTMQTESRLQELEGRLADAITLAAAAERSSKSSTQRRASGIVIIVDWLGKAIVLPMQMVWAVVSLPAQITASVFVYAEDFMAKKVRRELKTAGNGDGRVSSGSERRKPGKAPKKMM
ncbi:MAG: hypothetical protein Q9163_002592 [Psora crenata]